MNQSTPPHSGSSRPNHPGSPGGHPGGGSGGGPGAMPPPPPPGYMPPWAYGPPHGGSSSGPSVMRKVSTSIAATLILFSIGLNIYLGIWFAGSMRDVGLLEREFRAGDAAQRIVVLPVQGIIDNDMSGFVRDALRRLDQKPPRAIVLRIESGGGGITPSDQIYEALRQFRLKHPDVPIIASYGSLAASGGYYISAGADHIMAEPTSITGSIGVVAPVMTIDGLLDKIGITPEVIVATDSPDKDVANNILRPWEDRDREEVRRLLDRAHERFVAVVMEGRATKLNEAQVRELAKGQVFTTEEAIANDLIDGRGYLNDAIDHAIAAAGLLPDEPQVTVIRRPQPLLAALMGVQHQPSFEMTPDHVRQWVHEMSVPRLEYTYWPR